MAEFVEVPEDAAPPLWMSPVPADAVCSYAWSGCEHLEGEPDALEWIEFVEGKTLRWWQRLAIVRQLEHREDGSLCHKVVLDSGPRRIGKSVRMRGLAMWRMANATLFGERQVVVHTGSDVTVCRAMQKAAWPWSRSMGWKVIQANGKEAVETSEGDEWLVRSQKGVYGWDTTLALVDESWDVEPVTVSEGLEPSTMERSSAQLHMTSTAHRLATSLMRVRISTALAVDDGETLILIWAAPPGADVSDPATWRAASPHWTEDRRRMIAAKYSAALAGEVDPEADDPDPIAGFVAQYLNQWRLTERRTPGDVLVDEDAWAELGVLPEDRVPDAVAVESWYADGVTVAMAWRDGNAAVVSASDHVDLVAAVAAVKASRFRGRVTVGASLADDPALAGVRTAPSSMRTAAAVGELSRLLGDGVVRHDAGEHLTGQVLAVRTQVGVDGPRVVSKRRADAVKAAVWAIAAARERRTMTLGIASSG
ncbi:MAG: HNH endonuclease [Nocardioides sp.]|uniref:HNH endonuclease n=1 Tax=Nocardioides sp. TaxID=35761 RepID=UPI00239628B9|nr:HNH endonuclease [Nocardioides sp.]MDE0775545.1 HNH endonuclease [Nocardioides sp.]